MRQLLRHAATAARVASERSELWPPGALCWLAFLGWLPFAATVPGPPDEAQLTFFGAGLVVSGAWPYNAVLLAFAAICVVLAAFGIAALGEAALRIGLVGGWHRGWWPTARRVLAIRLIAAAPAAVGVLALLLGIVAVAPGQFSSPDIGGSVAARIATRVAPLIVIAVVLVLGSQAWAAAAERRAAGAGSLLDSLGGGLRQLRARPLVAGVVVTTTFLARCIYLAVADILLAVLWAPIGAVIESGRGFDAVSGLLLVGFVAIWLCLVLGGGALQAWASAWWTLELDALPVASRVSSLPPDTVRGLRAP
jgi:hypothetical protein